MYFMKRNYWIYLVVIVFAGMALGCAAKPTPSGFLDDYSNVQTVDTLVDSFKGIFVSKNPKKVITEYSKFKIEPVIVHFHSEADPEEISEEELQLLTEFYNDKITEIFSEKYMVVDSVGPDTAVLRTAVTDIKPNKIYLNLHWSTTLLGAGIGGADFEAEFLDSETGESILSIIDAKKGNKIKYHKGLTKWGHAKSVIKAWAKTLVKLVNEEHGY